MQLSNCTYTCSYLTVYTCSYVFIFSSISHYQSYHMKIHWCCNNLALAMTCETQFNNSSMYTAYSTEMKLLTFSFCLNNTRTIQSWNKYQTLPYPTRFYLEKPNPKGRVWPYKYPKIIRIAIVSYPQCCNLQKRRYTTRYRLIT